MYPVRIISFNVFLNCIMFGHCLSSSLNLFHNFTPQTEIQKLFLVAPTLFGNVPVWNDKLQMFVNVLVIPSITLFTTFFYHFLFTTSISSQSFDFFTLTIQNNINYFSLSTAVRNIENSFLLIHFSIFSSDVLWSGIVLLGPDQYRQKTG